MAIGKNLTRLSKEILKWGEKGNYKKVVQALESYINTLYKAIVNLNLYVGAIRELRMASWLENMGGYSLDDRLMNKGKILIGFTLKLPSTVYNAGKGTSETIRAYYRLWECLKDLLGYLKKKNYQAITTQLSYFKKIQKSSFLDLNTYYMFFWGRLIEILGELKNRPPDDPEVEKYQRELRKRSYKVICNWWIDISSNALRLANLLKLNVKEDLDNIIAGVESLIEGYLKAA